MTRSVSMTIGGEFDIETAALENEYLILHQKWNRKKYEKLSTTYNRRGIVWNQYSDNL